MIICDFLKKSILFVTLGKKMMNALKIWTCIKPWKVGKNWIVVFCFQGYCRARLYLKSYQKDFSLWFLSCTTFRHTPEIMDGCSDKPQKSKSCDFTYLVKYLFYDLLLFTFKKVQHFICDFYWNNDEKHQPRCCVNAEQGSWSQAIDICTK